MRPRRDPRQASGKDISGITGPVRHPRAKKRYEDTAVVLDVLPEGRGLRRADRAPLVQAVGQTWFTLLELVPQPNVPILPLDVVLIGSGERDQIETVKARVQLSDLTNISTDTLSLAVSHIVQTQERRFVDFFNKAQPITTRMHSLELLPGVGKTLMWEILEERKKIPFIGFEDIQERTKLQDVVKLVVKRVIDELTENPKHRLFTRGIPKTPQ